MPSANPPKISMGKCAPVAILAIPTSNAKKIKIYPTFLFIKNKETASAIRIAECVEGKE